MYTRETMGPRVLTTLLLTFLTVLPAGAAEDPARALDLIKPSRQRLAKDFKVSSLDGGTLRLSELRGKVVFLNLWATWCAPCREEMPALDRLQAELGGPRFEVLALSVDQQGPQIARKFFAEAGVKSLTLYVDPSAQAAFKLGTAGLPASLLVDANGREVGRHLGPAKWDSPEIISELRRRIEAAQR